MLRDLCRMNGFDYNCNDRIWKDGIRLQDLGTNNLTLLNLHIVFKLLMIKQLQSYLIMEKKNYNSI